MVWVLNVSVNETVRTLLEDAERLSATVKNEYMNGSERLTMEIVDLVQRLEIRIRKEVVEPKK